MTSSPDAYHRATCAVPSVWGEARCSQTSVIDSSDGRRMMGADDPEGGVGDRCGQVDGM